jgi:hypothetical protein
MSSDMGGSKGGSGVSVRVTQVEDGVQIYFTGDQAKQFDVKMLQACASELLSCARSNGCLSEGLKITQSCVETLARHNSAMNCVPQGFGLGTRGTSS